jgi:hypothetical protein
MDADETITLTATQWNEVIDRLYREAERPGTYALSTGRQSRGARALADFLDQEVDDVLAGVRNDAQEHGLTGPMGPILAATHIAVGLDWDSALTVQQLT